MSSHYGPPNPVERVNESRGWVGLAVGTGFLAVIAAVVALVWVATVYGLRVRNGSGEVACTVTTCSPAAVTVAGLVAALIPAVWCGVYALSFRRLKTLGRVLGAAFAVLLLASTVLYWPDRSRRSPTPLSTTEHGGQFIHGMALGFFALFVDVIFLIPAILLIAKKRGKAVPKLMWIILLAAPVALSAVAAATHP